jgi:hypothetical protein
MIQEVSATMCDFIVLIKTGDFTINELLIILTVVKEHPLISKCNSGVVKYLYIVKQNFIIYKMRKRLTEMVSCAG